ncbi:glycoside hydrolase family 5 protein [Dipodascopsis uninucleata]
MSSAIELAGILKTKGQSIVDSNGNNVILKGAALGGLLNMENFITGYAGHETEQTKLIRSAIGEEKTKFFYDRLYDYFWTEEDAKFFKSVGFNALRIPFNYRHFIDDMNPDVIKESGFELLDRVVERCAKYGIYSVLDLHAVPGGQNQDWHSDNVTNKALFWEFKDFQDRAVQLWVSLAEHYKGNPYIAGYNPLNEPADEEHVRLLAFYERIEKAIRAIDPDHILFLDGNTYAGDFSKFGEPLPNIVYSIHDYSKFGFPGFDYVGSNDQKAQLVRQYNRKVKEANAHTVPIWNGEFGPVYESEDGENAVEANKINVKRYNVLREQLKIYKENNVSWSIWVYKDIGLQGLVYVSPETPWMTRFSDFVSKKRRLGADFWGANPDKSMESALDSMTEVFKKEIPEEFHKALYPPLWDIKRQISRASREILLSTYLSYEFASLFMDLSYEQLDDLAASFKFENCIKRTLLNEYLHNDCVQE